MSLTVFAIILFGAALHATWNAVVKGGDDKLLTTCLITATGAMIAVLLLPFLTIPAVASWPFLLCSVLLQVIYYLLVAHTYRIADMGQAYPIMRGTAPLLVASVSVTLLSEPLPAMAWLGIGVVCVGILSMAVARSASGRRGLGLALLNACVIAAYTLVDGYGVRLSGAPAAYTLWIFLLTGVPMAAWAVASRRRVFVAYARANWRLGLIGGVGTVTSYGLALWAMTAAPVAVVSALRETSILFGAAISVLVLKESLTPARIIAACIIAAGVMILRMA